MSTGSINGTGGLGSSQSFINLADPLNLSGKASSSIAGNVLDPGNIWGLNPQVATNPRIGGNAANGAGGANGAAITLPAPNGSVTPITYNPNSFAPRQPAGPGAYNAMAAQLAGPVYVPQAYAPPVQSQAAAGPALAALLAQQLGPTGMTMPYNPKLSPMVYAR